MTSSPFPVAPAPCASCGATLWAEARFCHRCGTPVRTEGREPGAESRLVTILPWLLAALALGALVALLVGQRLGLGPSRLEPADTVVADSLR